MRYQPILKTDAITLRIAPFSTTSHVVTWLTPTHGKLVTVIKGACRPKPHAAGEYDLGWRCELLFYAYERQGLHTFKECSALDRRTTCRGHWQRTATLSYLCHLAMTATPDGAHLAQLYDLLEASLTMLGETPAPHDVLMIWFELKLLDLLGIAPRMEHCALCSKRLTTEEEVFFPPSAGGAVCCECATHRNMTSARKLSPSLRLLLRQCQRCATTAHLRTLTVNDADRKHLFQTLQPFLCWHLDLASESRTIASQMSNMQLGSNRKQDNV